MTQRAGHPVVHEPLGARRDLRGRKTPLRIDDIRGLSVRTQQHTHQESTVACRRALCQEKTERQGSGQERGPALTFIANILKSSVAKTGSSSPNASKLLPGRCARGALFMGAVSARC
jgi:hypothetical protein